MGKAARNCRAMKDYQKIIDDYPLLFSECKYIDCGIGWYDLIEDLCSKIHAEVAKEPMDGIEEYNFYPMIAQVKEKFGGLRFYMQVETEAMSKLIQEAERKSKDICEECGAPGSLRGVGWYYTSCEEHKRPLFTDEQKRLLGVKE